MRFYSQTSGCCYVAGLNDEMPVDAVPIDDERFNTVIGNPDPNKVRSHDEAGLPILIDPPPLTFEQLAERERVWRDGVITSCQWLRDRHRDEQDMQLPTTLTPGQFSELLVYRQGLRDWPQSSLFPDVEQRPAAPSWIAEQHL